MRWLHMLHLCAVLVSGLMYSSSGRRSCTTCTRCSCRPGSRRRRSRPDRAPRSGDLHARRRRTGCIASPRTCGRRRGTYRSRCISPRCGSPRRDVVLAFAGDGAGVTADTAVAVEEETVVSPSQSVDIRSGDRGRALRHRVSLCLCRRRSPKSHRSTSSFHWSSSAMCAGGGRPG